MADLQSVEKDLKLAYQHIEVLKSLDSGSSVRPDRKLWWINAVWTLKGQIARLEQEHQKLSK